MLVATAMPAVCAQFSPAVRLELHGRRTKWHSPRLRKQDGLSWQNGNLAVRTKQLRNQPLRFTEDNSHAGKTCTAVLKSGTGSPSFCNGVQTGDTCGVRKIPASEQEVDELLALLVKETRRLGIPPSPGDHSGVIRNVVAFSGGVDSSLVAYLVRQAFPRGSSCACIGRSAALPSSQLDLVDTHEGDLPEYVANEGTSCYVCKNTLYSTMAAVTQSLLAGAAAACNAPSPLTSSVVTAAAAARASSGPGNSPSQMDDGKPTAPASNSPDASTRGQWCGDSSTGGAAPLASGPSPKVEAVPSFVLFNGTNADDLRDPTRLGLLSAAEHAVASPLARVPKAAVRMLARRAGLPNWDLAAAPCLRSRLAYGVEATPATLSAVEAAETEVRRLLSLSPAENMRVRILSDQAAVLEVELSRLKALEAAESRQGITKSNLESRLQDAFAPLGLKLQEIREFRSGSLSMPMGGL
eukprot:jgi/Mesvir1/3391/Mv05092-RA.3